MIYLFFLLVSVLLWYLNALAKDYVTYLHYSVRYESYPKGKALISDPPAKLDLRVRGLGFTILRYKILSYSKTLSLPINYFSLHKNTKTQDIYYLPTRYTREWINSQLSSELQVLEVKPDTLIFQFTDVVEKKVPVRANLDIEFEKQYMQNGRLVVQPDSIVVNGPEVMVDTLKFVSTQLVQKKKVKQSISEEVGLLSIPKITFQAPSVKVKLPVEKFTEKVFSLPIETDNAPEQYRVRTFPGNVSVSFRVAMSAYDKITPYMFRVTVDYNSLISGSSSKAKVNLTKYPAMVQDIRVYPKNVDYLIEK